MIPTSTMMTPAMRDLIYEAKCPSCGQPCGIIAHGRGRCGNCVSEFALLPKVPPCPSCKSECVTPLASKHRCGNCGVIF
jgi:hypothetical protein